MRGLSSKSHRPARDIRPRPLSESTTARRRGSLPEPSGCHFPVCKSYIPLSAADEKIRCIPDSIFPERSIQFARAPDFSKNSDTRVPQLRVFLLEWIPETAAIRKCNRRATAINTTANPIVR